MMYKNLIDMTGLKFDRLLVLSLAYTKNKKSYWNCICDYGWTIERALTTPVKSKV